MLQEMGVTIWAPAQVSAAPAPVNDAARSQRTAAEPPTPASAVAAAGADTAATPLAVREQRAAAPGGAPAPRPPAPQDGSPTPALVLHAAQALYPTADPAQTPAGLGAGWLVVAESLSPTEPLAGDAGRLLDNMLTGAPVQDYGTWFSGVPGLYPVVGGAIDQLGGIALARAFGLVCMLWTTLCVYLITARLFGRTSAVFGSLSFVLTSAISFLSWYATFDAPSLALLATATLLVFQLAEEPAPYVSNVSFLYEPGAGLVGRYAKQHPVPFAEYIPNRSFWRIISTQVDLLGTDMWAGPGPVVFRVPAASGGEVVAGPSICFEVAYDELVRANVDLGANLLVVQTNNATFGFTNESVQQLAISRIRAIEHGRSVVHVSTVGVSALILPDGTLLQPTSLFTPAALAADLPLRTERTLAGWVGAWPEYCAVFGMLALLAGSALSRRQRKELTS